MVTRRSVVVCLTIACTAGSARADAPVCPGDYAEDLAVLSRHAREVERSAPIYSFAVRTAASYECVSYGSDGNLVRTRAQALAYGTAFGYRRDGGDTLLLTNDHVASWPAVTDAEHPVDGVAGGCKRVDAKLWIVDDDHDDYAPDDIPLAVVVSDPVLDVAVLRAHAVLGVLPWKVGTSAALASRDAVMVRGFPLGAFRATNVGKVISTHDHDEQGAWNHDDFVVDALLTSGGSGSPVLAVSCQTGEFELVGIFHARYSNASALNVVVAIDQVRELVTTLERPAHAAPPELDAAARARLFAAVRGSIQPAFFPFGSLVASVEPRDDGSLEFTVFSSDFPRTSRPALVIQDLPGPTDAPAEFGRLGTVAADGRAAGPAAEADLPVLTHALAMLRQDALATFDYRAAQANAHTSRDAFERAAKQSRALAKLLDSQHERTQAVLDLAGRLDLASADSSERAEARATR